MPIGPTVRRMLGPLDSLAASAYRRAFFSIDAFVDEVASATPAPQAILEVGAGEGAVAEGVLARNPEARYLGIDIAGVPGRLFSGDRSRASFRLLDVQSLPADDRYDLVLLVDVLHHVRPAHRVAVVQHALGHVAPAGMMIVKEWERRKNLAFAAGYFSDRIISGDRGVSFMSGDELLALLHSAAPSAEVSFRTRLPPRANNIVVSVAP